MRFLLYLLPILGALGGALVLVIGIAKDSSAPQLAAFAGVACALAIIPYVFARAIDAACSESVGDAATRLLAGMGTTPTPKEFVPSPPKDQTTAYGMSIYKEPGYRNM